MAEPGNDAVRRLQELLPAFEGYDTVLSLADRAATTLATVTAERDRAMQACEQIGAQLAESNAECERLRKQTGTRLRHLHEAQDFAESEGDDATRWEAEAARLRAALDEEHAAAEGALMVLTQEKAEVAKLRAEAKRMSLDYLALDGQIARLRAGIQAAVDGNIARPIGERWRADGEPSGHDRCIHGAMMNEDCPECLDAHLLALLGPAPDGGEGRG